MGWIQIIEGDLNDARSAPVILAAQTTVLAQGQADPLPALIDKVTQEIRGVVGFSGKYNMDGASLTTVPLNLKDMAVSKIVRLAKQRLNMPWQPADTDDEKTYQARLNSLRDGRWPVDIPDVVASVNPSLQQGLIAFNHGFRRRFTRRALRSL
jgi:hypothetical protein